MEKQYKVRGRTVTVEEVEGVRAISPEFNKNLGFKMEFEGLQEVPNAVKESWKPFANAGWMLIKTAGGVIVDGQKRIMTIAFEPNANFGRIFLLPESKKILISNGTLTVKLNPELNEHTAEQMLDELQLKIIQPLGFAKNLYQVKPKNNQDHLDISMNLSGTGNILYAEPGFIENIGQRFKPSDPEYPKQWHLNNTGQKDSKGTPGKPNADISAEKAWDTTRGSGIKIAVIDNGFDINHPDLRTGISKLSGYFADDTSTSRTIFIPINSSFPDEDHGTFCAGMAVARVNNGTDGCGVAPEAEFIAVACGSDQLSSQITLARSIAYAASPATEDRSLPSKGADVISCSLGPNSPDWQMQSVLQDAIDFAVTKGRNNKGTPVFWAVTNNYYPISRDEVCSYKNVIAVGRSTNQDTEDGSGYGPELKFLATGVEVWSTGSGGGMHVDTGTSFAAPVAASIGGLIMTVNPNLSRDEVLQIIIDTCDKIGGAAYDVNGHHINYGYGRVNAYMAVSRAGQVKANPAAAAHP